MNIKIAHESPISVFDIVRAQTDYDYALVHLLEENEAYRQKFLESKHAGREIYLDTSIFELGEAFDEAKFAEWVNAVKPNYYFVPDALEDMEKTISNMESWNSKYSFLQGGKIGVVQGKNFEEIVQCYDYMNEQADVDMIAISFDYSFFEKEVPHPNKYVSWALGRVKLLGDLYSQGIINENKKHHLLGCALPIEFRFYREAGYRWIYSLDTSNPVVHAIKGVKYEENLGLMNKESQKLFEMINTPAEAINKDLLFENLYTFRRIVNGKGMDSLF
jgi:hypothetical protein